MSIKLVSKTIKVNEETFAPELEMVILIPMETTQDNQALDPLFYENLGKELVSLLESK
jgi:hypothetical protein